jgi:acetylornithine deacetylase/succinyl-diaminopimelate desuccinylase-like protein
MRVGTASAEERAVAVETPRDDALAAEALEHLRALLRFDTTNPPGNETPAAEYLATALRGAGVGAEVIESAPGRGNLVARLPASGGAGQPEPALLLHAHLDVVPAREADGWTHRPFAGDVADGAVWGRGALDHKATVAMLLVAVLALRRSGLPLRRDVIFAATADEEAGGFAGAGWLVEHRPELLDATFCIGEGGGYSMYVGSRRFYPCSIAEKGFCRLRVHARGPEGHGAWPVPDNAILTLAEALRRMARPLPHHRVAAVDEFVKGLATLAGGAQGAFLNGLASTGRGAGLVTLAAERGGPGLRAMGRQLNPMLRNTASPTLLEAGLRDNVIPAEATATLDGRFLPGQTAESMVAELKAALGPQLARRVEIEADRVGPAVEMPWQSPLAETLVALTARHDPGTPVLPFMLNAVTDAKHLVRLPSLRFYYGFNPLRTPREFPLLEQLHAVDERVPVEALAFGAGMLADVLREFCAG